MCGKFARFCRSCLLILIAAFLLAWGFIGPNAVAQEPQEKSTEASYGFVITESGKRVEFDKSDFLWWAELSDEVELLVDGRNFVSIDRTGPIEVRGEKKDQRYIPPSVAIAPESTITFLSIQR